MKGRLLMQRLTSFAAIILVVEIVGGAVNSAIAQLSTDSSQSLQMAQSSSLQGNWRLANMTAGGSPMPMVPIQPPELTIDFAGDRVSGSGGCNRFMGGFETKGNQLSIGPLASTFKACQQPIMQQETKYLAALQGAQRYEVNKDGLQIFYKTEEGTGVLRFTRQGVSALW